ncbi:hypothetical protein D3C78_995890 [compost metagenome]
MARGLRRDHDHVEVGARHYLVVMDREAVSEGQGRTLLQVRLDLVLVQATLELVRSQDHHQVSRGNGFGNLGNLQAMGLSLGHAGRASAQTNGHVNAGILQVAGMGMTLGAVTDDGNLLALDDRQIAVFVVGNVHGKPSVQCGPAGLFKIRCLVSCRHERCR